MLKKLIPCLAALGTFAGPATAAAPFPAGPITIVVPNAAGGLADNIARPLADALGQELKQPVIVENKGGAGGVVGTGMVARAKPDGYTLLLTLSSISGLPACWAASRPSNWTSSCPLRASPPTPTCWWSGPTRHGSRWPNWSRMPKRTRRR